jgi:hypothetical protein
MTDYVPDFRPAAEGDDLPEEKTTIAAPTACQTDQSRRGAAR